MAVDGTWTITMQTPLGERTSSLALKSAGSDLSGTQSADGNATDIFDGAVKGNDVSWKVKITNPMPLTLEFTGNVDGNSMSGRVSAGMIGSWNFAGTRA
jgi:hypothetical protein